jgi:hypothetical protein
MTERDIWTVVYLLIVLVVLSVLWAVQLLALSGPQYRKRKLKREFPQLHRYLFEEEYEKNKQWARKQLGGRSTM